MPAPTPNEMDGVAVASPSTSPRMRASALMVILVVGPVILFDMEGLVQPGLEEYVRPFNVRAFAISRSAAATPPVFGGVHVAGSDVIHARFGQQVVEMNRHLR